jgi:hypothetical protein
MATFTSATVNTDLSTDARYQALWGTIVDTQIQGLGGWTYVSQTGDADPASTATGSNDTYPAFRCYSTTVGATTWYLRLDYGHGASGPKMKIQVGTTVNGSGTLGGQTSTQKTLLYPGTVGASQSVFLSAAAGRLMIQIGIGTSNGTWTALSVHGAVDNTGAMQSGIELFAYQHVTNTPGCQYVPSSGTVPAWKDYWPCAFGTEATQKIATIAMTGHPVLWDSTGANNPTLAVCELPSSDFSVTFSTNITIYGTSRTFLINGCFNVSAGSTNVAAGMRYE